MEREERKRARERGIEGERKKGGGRVFWIESSLEQVKPFLQLGEVKNATSFPYIFLRIPPFSS